MPLDRRRPHLVWHVLETRQPMIVQAVDAAYVESLVQHDEHRRALRALDIRSLMAVPLVARGRLLGALTFVSSRDDHRYGADDLPLARDLADRAALAIENARLYRTAREAIEARDHVLGVVAHDLRNPLTAISATATVLRQYFLPDSAGAAREALDGIVQASERATRLVQDLLEIRRITAGRLALTRAHVPVIPLVEECAAAHRALAAAASLHLAVDTADSDAVVWADGHRLRQVFDNLIGNAVKFTPAGGRVTLGAAARGAEVVFWVADTGPGIEPDVLPRLFDRFWQGREGDRRGAGLGLAIAKEVVDAHDGRIWAESRPGSGSTFYFSVPLAIQPAA